MNRLEHAIRFLENKELISKELLEYELQRNADTKLINKLKDEVEDVQNAILVLNASQQILNIGQIRALKRLQK